MIEENIVYKLIDNKYHFCYYSYEIMNDDREASNIVLHSFQFNKGEVGEINDFDCYIDEDINKIMQYKDEEIELYVINQIPSYKIDVSVNLGRVFKKIRMRKRLLWINHITRSIDNVSKSSGLGINNFIAPSENLILENGIYNTVVSVYNKDAFQKLFVEYLTIGGIKSDEVMIHDII